MEQKQFQPGRIPCLLPLVLLLGVPAGSARADLQVAQPVIELGEVRSGPILRQRFSFVNQGKEPVEIIGARASCGCLTPRLEARTYPPGAAGSVLMEVNTLSQTPGPHSWFVHLSYKNGAVYLETALQLQANLIAEVTVRPAAVTLFADKAMSHELVLTDPRPRPLTVQAVQTSAPKLQARLGDEYRDDLGRRVRKIHVALAEDYAEGRHEEVVVIHTDDPLYQELRVLVTIVKRSPQQLSVLPNAAHLAAPPGQPVPARMLLVRDNAAREVIVERVDADDPAIVCTWAAGPGPMATIKITIDKSRVKGTSLHSAIHIHIRQPLQQTLSVPVSCDLQ